MLIALAGGVGVSIVLQRSGPIGVLVSNTSVTARILGDNFAPQLRRIDQDVTLVVFTDYQCPACRGANRAMQRAVADDPRVGVIFKDWPIFGARSVAAARTAIAASFQNRYAAVHDALMRWPRLLDDASVKAAALSVGIDWERLEADRREQRERIDSLLRQTALDAFSLGLRGTPAYLANHMLSEGALTKSEFRRLFERARNTPG